MTVSIKNREAWTPNGGSAPRTPRTTKKWAESAGAPLCPCSRQPMVFETKPPKEG